MLSEAYLGLGSNLGDRAANIGKGLKMLREISKNMVTSSLYETTPQGFGSQPPFLNATCRLWTWLDPFQLMAKLREIEHAVGRRRAFVNAPRTLDLDILLYGRVVLRTLSLVIPHPMMAERAFVLAPLAEIAPEVRHPILKETIRALLTRLSSKALVYPPGVTRVPQLVSQLRRQKVGDGVLDGVGLVA
jgi:2-amino-4-hydroxy-6-hydroxymethyldihydropteridine diphosphokinase